MITAWDIYWVMQLDSIGSALTALTFFGGVLGGGAYTARAVAKGFSDEDEGAEAFVKATGFVPYVFAIGVLAFAVNTALPSTKTAAAMVILPAVANNQAIQKEAGDLYGIAKDALRELAKPKREGTK